MSPTGGLGKGLGALIPTGASALEELPLGVIRPNPRQPRREFEEEGIANLAASIRQVGLLQPIVVRGSADGTYEIVVGERRWRAAQRAGLSELPAIIVETDDKGSLERALVENVHRRDLNPLEEAAAYHELINEAGLTHEALAERLGLSRPAISNAIRLLDLPAGAQKLVLEGKLAAGSARALLGIGIPAMIERLAIRVAAEGLSVRETEDLVRRHREASSIEPIDTASAVRRPQPAGLLELSERLSDDLQTRVLVSMGKRKGRIVIEFGSVDDLERIYQKITGAD